jgi:hypothetical protein
LQAVLQLPAASGVLPAGQTQAAWPAALTAQAWPVGHATPAQALAVPQPQVVLSKAAAPVHRTSGQVHAPLRQYWPGPQLAEAQVSVPPGSQLPSALVSAQQAPATQASPVAQLQALASSQPAPVSASQPLQWSPVPFWKLEKPVMVAVAKPSWV